MIAFEVHDMNCGHCVGTITRALKELDPEAAVQIDLARRRVQVQPAAADAVALADAISRAGFTPVPTAALQAADAPGAAGCCGCR